MSQSKDNKSQTKRKSFLLKRLSNQKDSSNSSDSNKSSDSNESNKSSGSSEPSNSKKKPYRLRQRNDRLNYSLTKFGSMGNYVQNRDKRVLKKYQETDSEEEDAQNSQDNESKEEEEDDEYQEILSDLTTEQKSDSDDSWMPTKERKRVEKEKRRKERELKRKERMENQNKKKRSRNKFHQFRRRHFISDSGIERINPRVSRISSLIPDNNSEEDEDFTLPDEDNSSEFEILEDKLSIEQNSEEEMRNVQEELQNLSPIKNQGEEEKKEYNLRSKNPIHYETEESEESENMDNFYYADELNNENTNEINNGNQNRNKKKNKNKNHFSSLKYTRYLFNHFNKFELNLQKQIEELKNIETRSLTLSPRKQVNSNKNKNYFHQNLSDLPSSPGGISHTKEYLSLLKKNSIGGKIHDQIPSSEEENNLLCEPININNNSNNNNNSNSNSTGNNNEKKKSSTLRESNKNNVMGPITIDQAISFNSVGGLKEHLRALKEVVMLPLLYPEVFTKFGIKPPRGLLFTGPPGTGKTLVARALANSCQSIHGKKISFFMRKGSDCLSKWIGEAERQLRLLFQNAKKYEPSIIFFDEIDGLAPVRSSKQDQIHSSIVSTLLCLHKDTPIYLENNRIIKIEKLWKSTKIKKKLIMNPQGEITQIKKLKNKTKIYGLNKENKINKSQIKYISKTKIRDPIKIVFKNKSQIIGSKNTKLLKLLINQNNKNINYNNNNSDCNHNQNYSHNQNHNVDNYTEKEPKKEWVFLKDLKINHKIAIPHKLKININKFQKKKAQNKWSFVNNDKKFKSKNTDEYLNFPKYYSKELVILLSLILKSNEFSKLNGIIFQNKDLKKIYKKLIYNIFGKINNPFKNITLLKYFKKVFKINWFSKNKENDHNMNQNKIPTIVYLLPNKLKKLFFNFYNTNHFLKNFKISTQKKKKRKKTNENDNENTNDNINDNANNMNDEIKYLSIESIIQLKGMYKMYDLCTGNENFLAGSDQPIIVHNSMMDGLEDRGNVVVIGATNRVDAIDPALRRPGRFDREFLFPLPDKKGRKEILGIHTKHWNPPLTEEFKNLIVKLTVGYCGADIKALTTEAALRAVRRVYPQIYKSDNKLEINLNNISITKFDFFEAMKQLVPTSYRTGFSTAKPLTSILKPLLQEDLGNLEKMLIEIFPIYFEKKKKHLKAKNRKRLHNEVNELEEFDNESNELTTNKNMEWEFEHEQENEKEKEKGKENEKEIEIEKEKEKEKKENENEKDENGNEKEKEKEEEEEEIELEENNNDKKTKTKYKKSKNTFKHKDEQEEEEELDSDELYNKIEEEELMMNCLLDNNTENIIHQLFQFEKTHHRPRLLINSESDNGQNYLAEALLHLLDEFAIFKINLSTLVGDQTIRSPEEILTTTFNEAIKNVPSIIFVPNIESLCFQNGLNLVKKTFLSLLKEIPASTPLLLLCTSESPIEFLDQEIRQLFSKNFHSYKIDIPNIRKRKKFFKSFFIDLLKPPISRNKLIQKRKEIYRQSIINLGMNNTKQNQIITLDKKLEEELLKKRQTEQELELQREEEIYLRELRLLLRDLVFKLLSERKFKFFFQPVDEDEYPDYYNEIQELMDFSIIMEKIDSAQYLCINDFIKDVQLIRDNTEQFKGWDDYNQLVKKANWLIDALDSLISCVEPELIDECSEIAKRRTSLNIATKKRNPSLSFYFNSELENIESQNLNKNLYNFNLAETNNNEQFGELEFTIESKKIDEKIEEVDENKNEEEEKKDKKEEGVEWGGSGDEEENHKENRKENEDDDERENQEENEGGENKEIDEMGSEEDSVGGYDEEENDGDNGGNENDNEEVQNEDDDERENRKENENGENEGDDENGENESEKQNQDENEEEMEANGNEDGKRNKVDEENKEKDENKIHEIEIENENPEINKNFSKKKNCIILMSSSDEDTHEKSTIYEKGLKNRNRNKKVEGKKGGREKEKEKGNGYSENESQNVNNDQSENGNNNKSNNEGRSDIDMENTIVLNQDNFLEFKKLIITETEGFTVENLLFAKSRFYHVHKNNRKQYNKNLVISKIIKEMKSIKKIINN
ncbi:intein-containing tat-binding precursor [Anaeramoeba flamelloides]|uniref:Intein-containing tat-binding n=1 Tax=Anaeramoeba flamelloides TaxID=1746091 RepID=A0AAV7Z5N4_9EUKA|nr:intein-containing tat-binding precursor [Anaeramoeba flamelloides]